MNEQVRISAKDYRNYVEGKAGIPALQPKRVGQGSGRKGGGAKPTANAKKSERAGKYNARGRTVNGKWMASEAQAVRYEQLLVLEGLGIIRHLKVEDPFILNFNGVHVCTYRADATYTVVAGETDCPHDYRVIEDVKGMRLPEYQLKKKMMSANGTPITEIPASEVQSWHMRVPPPPSG